MECLHVIFKKLFGRYVMSNEEMIEKIGGLARELPAADKIAEKTVPYLEAKAAKMQENEFHPWLKEWYLTEDFLRFVYNRFGERFSNHC
ncbi:hypothetical protein [Peribacillus glennii]|uniref:Uncharacterized protein n=1 Tax=Peribacillus glennii TaxID=2303991 RepID=A0A372LH89_9BACI|nr:hypothetical protein [Peribacillus glennii]RFU65312.1 hypothetical protein D0466_05280 [Peribacillus glennii]